MRIVFSIFILIAIGLIAAVLHYNLPSRDIVRVVGTDVKRMDVNSRELIKEGDGTGGGVRTRDVRFINGFWPHGGPRVYRNEDTDWGFPPYFKFDSSNLQAEAQAYVSTAEKPIWVVVTHYGWRIPILSMFPNAISIREANSRDELLIPWFNIAFLLVLGGLLFLIWRTVRMLRRRHVDPVLDDIADTVSTVGESASRSADAVEQRATGVYERWQRWLDTWRPKHKRRYRR